MKVEQTSNEIIQSEALDRQMDHSGSQNNSAASLCTDSVQLPLNHSS
jgi:hypothetical protein